MPTPNGTRPTGTGATNPDHNDNVVVFPAGTPAGGRVQRLADRFRADDRGHYRVNHNPSGPPLIEIVNARVAITTAYADDTAEPYPLAETDTAERTQSVVTHYDLTVSRPDSDPVELPDVPHDDFGKVAWIDRAELSGLPVLTASGHTARQDIVTAIRSSCPYSIVPAYGRLGWHYRGGRWIYIHGGGAWSATGAVPDIRVHGDGLAVYSMSPPPVDQAGGQRAFEALWGLFGMGPDRCAAVEIGAAYRASMGRPVGSITYLAVNQSGKSGRAAFISQCWAPGVRWRRMPFSAGRANATPTYIELVHSTYGDMFVPWDDMAPVGTAMERGQYFDQFARSLFNGSSKGRANRDVKARARMRPRAFGVLTAEDISAVESGQNRTHIIALERNEFDPAAYAKADQGTGPADRSALMSAFIVWWAGRMPAHSWVAESERTYAAELARATGAPSRYVESVADKAAGIAAGLEHALSAGWVTQERSDALWARAWAGLVESLQAQVRANDGQAIHERIRDAILDGLLAHEAHVLGMDGKEPLADALSLGWDHTGQATGRHIGWTDCERLYLLPSACGAFVTSYTGRTGVPLDITHRAMGEALKTAGLIPGSTQRGKNGRPEHRSTTPKKVLGKFQRVWSLRWEPDPVEDQEPDPVQPESPQPDPAGPVEGRLEHPAPCAGCGDLSSWQRNGVPLHGGCDAPAPVRPETPPPVQQEIPEPVARVTAPAGPEPSGSTTRTTRSAGSSTTRTPGALAVAADLDGLYLPGGEALDPAGALENMAALLDRVAALMPSGGSVAITAEVAATLGYPDAPPVAETFAAEDERKTKARKKKAAPPVEPRAAVEGKAGGWWPPEQPTPLNEPKVSGNSKIGTWTTWRQPATGLRINVLVIQWSGTGGGSHVYIRPDLAAPEAANRLAAWRTATGTPYVITAGITGCNMLVANRHFYREALQKWDAPTDCPAFAGVEKGFNHVRPVEEWTDAERAGSHVIAFDMRKAYLAAFAGADFAMDRLEHIGHGGFDKVRAGYWEISREWRPYPMLPDLRGKRLRETDGPMWVSTPTAELLIKTGMPEEMITDAWLSPRESGHSARIGKPMAETLRDALRSCQDADLRDALKACYRETYGQIQRATGSVHRKDWADTIIGYCRASVTRNVIRIGQDTGRWPVAMNIDCAYYVAGAETDNPGFDLTDTPGKFGLKSVQTVDEYLGKGE